MNPPTGEGVGGGGGILPRLYIFLATERSNKGTVAEAKVLWLNRELSGSITSERFIIYTGTLYFFLNIHHFLYFHEN